MDAEVPTPKRAASGWLGLGLALAVFGALVAHTNFLIDDAFLGTIENELGLVRAEPLKTVSVGGYRAMATWIFGAATDA